MPFKGLDSVVDQLSRWLSLMPQAEISLLLPPPMVHHIMGCRHAAPAQALGSLDLAISGLTRMDMGYLASCAKARRGATTGGQAGRELLKASTEQLVSQGIVNVEGGLAMSAPGFRGASR